ncbi:SERTA domain-containing protein 3 [Stygiomarasmius scandens]|uniref:SERTA domain-containing protein 3 n=1 Tax=Marasmiellus scandens TaxID=2682957 RepID=A0ABR1IVK3_9AGAR
MPTLPDNYVLHKETKAYLAELPDEERRKTLREIKGHSYADFKCSNNIYRGKYLLKQLDKDYMQKKSTGPKNLNILAILNLPIPKESPIQVGADSNTSLGRNPASSSTVLTSEAAQTISLPLPSFTISAAESTAVQALPSPAPQATHMHMVVSTPVSSASSLVTNPLSSEMGDKAPTPLKDMDVEMGSETPAPEITSALVGSQEHSASTQASVLATNYALEHAGHALRNEINAAIVQDDEAMGENERETNEGNEQALTADTSSMTHSSSSRPVQVSVDRNGWPAWLEAAFKTLARYEQLQEVEVWINLLEEWVALEWKYGFENPSSSSAFYTKVGHPELVDWWSKVARKKVWLDGPSSMPPVNVFAQSFQTWWAAINPDWHERDVSNGSL